MPGKQQRPLSICSFSSPSYAQLSYFFKPIKHTFGKLGKFRSEGAAMFVKGFNHGIIHGIEKPKASSMSNLEEMAEL